MTDSLDSWLEEKQSAWLYRELASCESDARIAELFRERSIRIPYPTQEFLLKGLPRNVEPNLLSDNEFVARDGRG